MKTKIFYGIISTSFLSFSVNKKRFALKANIMGCRPYTIHYSYTLFIKIRNTVDWKNDVLHSAKMSNVFLISLQNRTIFFFLRICKLICWLFYPVLSVNIRTANFFFFWFLLFCFVNWYYGLTTLICISISIQTKNQFKPFSDPYENLLDEWIHNEISILVYTVCSFWYFGKCLAP